MSRGKYSPNYVRNKEYIYNCYGELPAPYNLETDTYDEKIHFADYDDEGYDSYGYSAFDTDRNYVGIGQGIDRNGYTEDQYMSMTDDEWDNVYHT